MHQTGRRSRSDRGDPLTPPRAASGESSTTSLPESPALLLQRLQAVLDSAPFGVHMYELDGDDRLVFVGCNRKAGEMLGIDHERLVGLTLEEAFPGNIGTETPARYRAAARDGITWEADQYAYDAEGIAGVFQVIAFPYGPDRVTVFFRDVTEQRKLEIALQDSEVRYKRLFDNMREGFAYCRVINDADGRPVDWVYLDANERFSAIVGLTDVVGKRISQLAPDLKERRPDLYEACLRVALTGVSEAFDINGDGWTHFSVTCPEKGHFVLVGEDISERKAAEAGLRASEARFRQIFEDSSVPMSMTAPSGPFLPNQALCDLLGYTRQELEAGTWMSITHPDDVEPTKRQVHLLMSGSVPSVRFEKRFVRRDGAVVWVDLSSTLRRDEGAPPGSMISVIVDITARHEAEQRLLESEERYRAIASNTPDHILIQDEDLRYVLVVNPQLGLTEQDMIGMTDAEFLDPEDAEKLAALKRRVMETRQALEVRTSLVDKSGQTQYFDGVYTPRLGPDGESRGLIGYFRNVTGRVRAEEELRTLNEELERRVGERTSDLERVNQQLTVAAAAKTDFLRDMSHELRTPLNSIIGFSSILAGGLAGDLNPEQSKQIRMIHSSGEHLLSLINELLDLSTIEGGQMRFEMRPFPVAEFVTEVAGSMAPLAHERGLDLTWGTSETAGAVVSDRVRLGQVLLNLLGNAVKFTGSGFVRLEASRQGDDLVLVVSDSGRGISERDLHRIFDEFYQVEDPAVAKTQGTGLGLSVSKRLVELLGGTIEVTSALGGGTTFTVRIPVGDA